MPKTIGPITSKRYGCSHCGHVSKIATNHWGEIYSPCPACQWRRPFDATVSVCLEPRPEGFDEPVPWRICRLRDLIAIR